MGFSLRVFNKIRNSSVFELINYFYLFIARLKTYFFYRFFFGHIGCRSAIYKPFLITNPDGIYLGDFVTIRKNVRLEIIKNITESMPKIIIGNNVNIEQNVHIICGSRIEIGNNVSITGGVAIVDVNHPYDDIYNSVKIGDRIQCEGNYVEISDNVFIGYGAIILPNVSVGKNSIIGAYSVVNRDIPDFSVVAGNPAKIIKIYCFETNNWIKV